MATQNADGVPVIFWHRELPPLDADAVGEYTLEAASGRVPAGSPSGMRSGTGVMKG